MRNELIRKAYLEFRYSMAAIARQLGIHDSSVSKINQRGFGGFVGVVRRMRSYAVEKQLSLLQVIPGDRWQTACGGVGQPSCLSKLPLKFRR
jgi:hypothetical protein